MPYTDIESIFKEYKNKIYRLSLSISRNEKDAEDILQNTFLRIMHGLGDFKEKSMLSTWIYRIAYNEALQALRRRGRQSRLYGDIKGFAAKKQDVPFINWAKLPDEKLLDSEFRERIDAAIKEMSIKYRMPLFLHHMSGLSVKESAEVLGLKTNTLKTRLHRAYLIIRKELSNYLLDRQKYEVGLPKQCSIWTGFIYNYAKDNLDKEKNHAFNLHIEDCPNCKLFIDSYINAIRITGALECRDLPAELQAKIESFLLKKL